MIAEKFDHFFHLHQTNQQFIETCTSLECSRQFLIGQGEEEKEGQEQTKTSKGLLT